MHYEETSSQQNLLKIVAKNRKLIIGSLLLCCALFLMFSASSASAAGPTYVNSDIMDDTTWNEAGSPYIVTDNITIAEGVTLTIDANVTVMINYNTDIFVDGEIFANGTAGKMVQFTANNTASGWNGITSTYTSSITFNYVYFNNATGMTLANEVFIDHSRFIDVRYNCVVWIPNNISASLTVTNSYFRHTGYVASNVITASIEMYSEYAWDQSFSTPIVIENNEFAGGQALNVVDISYAVYASEGASIALDSPITFQGNTFKTTTGTGLAVNRVITAGDNATATITGDIAIQDNTFDGLVSGYQIADHVNAVGQYRAIAGLESDATVSGNTFGVNVGYDGSHTTLINAYGSGYANATQNININGNTFNADNEQAISVARGGDAYDNATIAITGEVLIELNTVGETSTGDFVSFTEGINLHGLYNTTATIIGDLMVAQNTADYIHGSLVVISVSNDAVGYGDIIINTEVMIEDNTVDDISGSLVMYDSESITNGHSTLAIVFPVTVQNNAVTHGYRLVYVDLLYLEANDDSAIIAAVPLTFTGNNGFQMSDMGFLVQSIFVYGYDNGQVTANVNILVNDNIVLTTSGYSLNIDRVFEANDDSVLVVESAIDIQGNTFEAQAGEGVYISDSVTAYNDKIGASITLIGDVKVTGNYFKLTDGSAISYYFEPYGGSDTYGAEVNIDMSAVNWFFQDNMITETDVAHENIISWESEYYGFYNDETVDGGKLTIIIGDVIITGNNMDVTGNGADEIFVNVDIEAAAYNGGTMISLAGDFIAEENTINIKGDNHNGIEMYVDYLFAHAEGGNATSIVGTLSVSHNLITGVGASINAIYLDPDNDCIYAVAYGAHDYLVEAYAAATGGMVCADNIISVEGGDCAGVYLDIVENYAFSSNFLANATMLFDITITGNIIEGINESTSWTEAIYLDGFQITAEYTDSYAMATTNLLIEDNVFVMSGYYVDGIYAIELLAFAIDHSSFIGNAWVYSSIVIQQNAVEGGGYGIYIEDSTYNVQVIDNIVAKTIEEAFTFYDATGEMTMNTAMDNYGDGFVLYNADNAVLRDNNAVDNDGYGLSISNSDMVVIYNGVYNDNSNDGIYTTGSDVTWIIDGESTLIGNDAAFAGHVFVMEGGVLTIDLCTFVIDDAVDGTTLIQVDQGGELIASNTVFIADGSYAGLFIVNGKLSMLSCTMEYWYQLYLGPTSDAAIGASNFIYQERYGIYIDGCSPRIANSVFSLNSLAGVYVSGEDAAPSIELCLFFMNPRGIYAENANLGDVVNNIFAVNYESGIYAEKVTGKISANTFVLNKVEIYLTDSVVIVSDNEIGWSHLIDVAGQYSPVASVIVNYLADMVSLDADITDLLSSVTGSSLPGIGSPEAYIAAILTNHDGIMAYNSTVTCTDNSYGMVSWAIHAEGCTIYFADVVKTNTIKLVWLNKNMVSTNLTIPLTAMNGVYARNSQVTLSGATVEVLDTSVFLSESKATITNSKLLADQYDIYAVGNSSISMSGTVLDGKVKAVGDAVVTAEFQLDILTTDAKGNIVTGVKVTVKNAQGVIVASGVSGADGHFKCSVVAYKIVNGNKDTSMNPYSVTADFNNGAVTDSVSLDGATAMTVVAKADNTALFVGIVAIAAVFLLIAAAVLMRRKN